MKKLLATTLCAILYIHYPACGMYLACDDINSYDELAITTFQQALLVNSEYHIKKFIDEGADVNEANQDGLTPLHWIASLKANNQLINILMDRGARIDAIDKHGRTPLHLLCGKARLSVIVASIGKAIKPFTNYDLRKIMLVGHLKQDSTSPLKSLPTDIIKEIFSYIPSQPSNIMLLTRLMNQQSQLYPMGSPYDIYKSNASSSSRYDNTFLNLIHPSSWEPKKAHETYKKLVSFIQQYLAEESNPSTCTIS